MSDPTAFQIRNSNLDELDRLENDCQELILQTEYHLRLIEERRKELRLRR